ncbi:hypothetical protein Celal_1440 [Cellulophaga algicola DSM 14237]|uniref:Uncharacterized protein n=1 Tax=Cellulophaga algicola (strain DSM 14237 / IC166 / ACAM 630) TaxID=688270 RepID=E6X9K3_CELAD|nr:hypothetical protein [Cellulophaga algicola]ADV48753.1 hypothetical protein Celal_1440 [Cellulophaga algicola DSM 14237]
MNEEFKSLKRYIFEGANYNISNFNRALVFYDDQIFKKASLEINPLDTWINAYYWYSIYINELKKQNISIGSHKQSKLKLIEQIDYFTASDFDWSIIEQIDNELH